MIIKWFSLIVAAVLAATVTFGTPLFGQANEVEALNKRVMSLYQAGKSAEAIPLARQMLAMLEKMLGPDHPNVAASLNNLASLYEDQGRYADAEPLSNGHWRSTRRRSGPIIPMSRASLSNLGSLYTNARPLHRCRAALQAVACDPGEGARS